MCGIVGIFGSGDSERVTRMVAALRHRGPDDSGIFGDDTASLGMTRLAIIDLTPAGHQPMAGPDGHVHIVFNGEIYNYRQLRTELADSGWQFISESDTEVILAVYYKYGEDCVHRLRGMFAFAVYDCRGGVGRERLFLARDHLGIKPLLYARTPQHFVFASELKGILASGLVAPEIDADALRDLLAQGSVAQPRTMLAGVNALLPAHRMVVERGCVHLERYWTLATGRCPEIRNAPYHEIVERVEHEILESVKLHLVADVPVGAFLSGGIDSSLLVAMMSHAHTGLLRTYSVGYRGAGACVDETDDAELVAQVLGTTHERVEVTGEDVLSHMPRMATALDQPSVDGINSYFVSWAASEGLKVAVSGTGGDELFAGYPWFTAMNQYQLATPGSSARGAVRRLIASATRHSLLDRFKHGRLGRALSRLHGLDFLGHYAAQYQIFGPTGAEELLAPEWRSASRAGRDLAVNLALADELPHAGALERATALCLRGYTQNQLLRDIDAVSMSYSLEVRVPFLDRVVADLALSLPVESKLGSPDPSAPKGSYRATGIKRVLLDIGRKWLPEGFDVRAKRPFAMPFDAWLRGPLRDVCHDLLSRERVAARGLLDPDAVAKTVEGFDAGAAHWSCPWLLVVLELWLEQVIDRTGRQGSVPSAANGTPIAEPTVS